MKVPTVTAEDLAAFHARVYGRPAPSASLPDHVAPQNQTRKRKRSKDNPPKLGTDQIIGENDVDDEGSEEDEVEWGAANEDTTEYDEDDGLGCYPDGVKRTLTDEQIAMFRHSELYAIQRRREVAKENREAEGGEVEDEEEGEIDEEDGAFAAQYDEVYTPIVETEEDNHENGILEVSASPSSPQTPNPNQHPTQPPQNPAASRNQRRKRNKLSDKTDETNKERQSRAQVRELDAITAQEQALDYGDEELDYGEDSPAPLTTKPPENPNANLPREGKRIWWPVLAE